MPVSELFIAEITLLQLLDHKPIFSQGYKSVLHIHTVQEECELKEIDISWEKDDKGVLQEKLRPKFAQSGSKLIAKIIVNKPICIEKHETNVQMGRFTLRDEGRTIALGKVIKYKPAKLVANDDGLSAEQREQV